MPSAATVFVVVAAGLLAAGGSLSAQHATVFAIEDGGRAFRNSCANCHGPDDDQIAGIDLDRGQFRRPLSDPGSDRHHLSYSADGRQYVAIAAGSALFAYALPETP